MNYFFSIFLIILFFIYGLFLSLVIDYLFPDLENNQPEYLVLIETLFELFMVYVVYYYMKKYINSFINVLIPQNNLYYLDQLLLFSFSCGIYFYLKKYSEKMKYFQNKYIYNTIKKNKYYKNIKKIFLIK